MSQAFILDITAKALILVLILSMPPIIAATLMGLLVSLLQALTQIQEQTLSFRGEAGGRHRRASADHAVGRGGAAPVRRVHF
jgi:hypothetical protein